MYYRKLSTCKRPFSGVSISTELLNVFQNKQLAFLAQRFNKNFLKIETSFQSAIAYFVKNPEGFSHPLLVLGIRQDLGHGDQEFREVDFSVAVSVPHPHPVDDLLVRHLLSEAGQDLAELQKGNQTVLVAVEVSERFLDR